MTTYAPVQAIYVPLRREALVKLAVLAERERRRPRDQATVLLELALANVAPGDQTERPYAALQEV